MNAERKLNELTKELEVVKTRLALLEKMAIERTEKRLERFPATYPSYPTSYPYYCPEPHFVRPGSWCSAVCGYECG